MKLYNIPLSSGLLLAPMSGYTNWPMRLLCRRYGAEICYTEMVSSSGLVKNIKSTLSLIQRPEQDAPLVAQIFTASPTEAALSARIIEDAGFDGIDINMGCPVRKVVHKGAGSALMQNPDLAERIAEAVVMAVSIPASVKIRAGWDSSSVNAGDFAAALSGTGIDCITIHPRTRAEMYRGNPRWDLMPELRNRLSIPVVASGNITAEEDLGTLRSLGAYAFMVGRGAVGNPWIFRELTGGPEPSADERREVMLEHLDMLACLFGDGKAVRYMRKFLSAYVRGLPGATAFRMQSCSTDKIDSLQRVINAYFDSLE